MNTIDTMRELTTTEIDSVSGGHDPSLGAQPETLGQTLQNDPGRIVALGGDVAALPGGVVSSTPLLSGATSMG